MVLLLRTFLSASVDYSSVIPDKTLKGIRGAITERFFHAPAPRIKCSERFFFFDQYSILCATSLKESVLQTIIFLVLV